MISCYYIENGWPFHSKDFIDQADVLEKKVIPLKGTYLLHCANPELGVPHFVFNIRIYFDGSTLRRGHIIHTCTQRWQMPFLMKLSLSCLLGERVSGNF